MRPSMHTVLPQELYASYLTETNAFTRDIAKSIPADELAKMRAFKNRPIAYDQAVQEGPSRREFAKRLMKEQVRTRIDAMQKAGVTSSTGYNFYDLRGPAYLLYPVNVPFRNMLARSGRVNDGYGTAANWKATREFGTVYAGVSEGNRNAAVGPDKNDYVATYKEIGVERDVTFTAQFAGEGYTDNVADEHLRGLHQLWLQEEGLNLMGNAGTATGNNGFALGTMNTPAGTLAASGGTITTARYVTAMCVAITGLGLPNNAQYGYLARPTATGGLTPSFSRTNADGSQDTINGGTSKISVKSAAVLTTGSTDKVTFVATGKTGALGYAWYIAAKSADTSATSEHYLYSITSIPTVVVTADPDNGNQAADAAGLSVDHSMQTLDYDGLLTYAATQGRWVDQAGASFTSDGANGIVEIDADLKYLWDNFQAQVNAIWFAADAKVYADQTIMANGGNPGAFRFDYSRDGQGNILGGYTVAAYKSKFAIETGGGAALPMRIHPMLPPGTIYYDIAENPYPHSRVPFVRGLLVQRDYYSIEWPIVSRRWTFGTYTHQVLAHHMPWMSAVRTGVGGADTN